MSEIVQYNENSKFTLALPEDVFADIVLNFLGNKESLSYIKNTYFRIDLRSIKQFSIILNDKIDKEQTTNINFFRVSIAYDDDTTRHINTLENLESYYEMKSVVPTAITMTWKVILNFPNSKTIETQTINLTYTISDEVIDGKVLLNIEHTNQSWGTEVQNLFINQIKKNTIPPKKQLEKINSSIQSEFPAFTVILLIIGILYLYIGSGSKISSGDRYTITETIIESSLDTKNTLLLLNSVNNDSDEKLSKYAVKYIKEKEIIKSIESYIENKKDQKYKKLTRLGLIVIGVISFFSLVGFYLSAYKKYYREKSFILITDTANKSYESYKESKNKAMFYSLSALFFAVTTGLISSFLYSLVVKIL